MLNLGGFGTTSVEGLVKRGSSPLTLCQILSHSSARICTDALGSNRVSRWSSPNKAGVLVFARPFK